MKLRVYSFLAPLSAAAAAAAFVVPAATGSAADVPLKEAKLNIEHNATDEDTGFQGAIDSEGWRRLDVPVPAARCCLSKASARSASWG